MWVCSVAELCLTVCAPWTAAPRLPCPSLSPGVCSDSRALSRWCHPIISSSVVPFFSCPQSFPASGSQSIGASASVLPMNIQDWFPLELTGLISLVSKGLSRVFSSTTVQKHQFLGDQPFLWSSSHIHTGTSAKMVPCINLSSVLSNIKLWWN